MAQEWQRMLEAGQYASRADLARQLGVTRARVTQILDLLNLTPEVVDALAALGDPLSHPIVTERGLRALLKRPAREQQQLVRSIASKTAVS